MHQDVCEILSVVPHGELLPFLENLIVLSCVWQLSERVDVLLHGGLTWVSLRFSTLNTGASP